MSFLLSKNGWYVFFWSGFRPHVDANCMHFCCALMAPLTPIIPCAAEGERAPDGGATCRSNYDCNYLPPLQQQQKQQQQFQCRAILGSRRLPPKAPAVAPPVAAGEAHHLEGIEGEKVPDHGRVTILLGGRPLLWPPAATTTTRYSGLHLKIGTRATTFPVCQIPSTSLQWVEADTCNMYGRGPRGSEIHRGVGSSSHYMTGGGGSGDWWPGPQLTRAPPLCVKKEGKTLPGHTFSARAFCCILKAVIGNGLKTTWTRSPLVAPPLKGGGSLRAMIVTAAA